MSSLSLRLGCYFLLLASGRAAPAPWPHEQSDLAPDPAIVWGRLDNGLRYAIRPNDHRTRREIELLAEVLKNRLSTRIREEMGATYSPACGVWRSELQPENAFLVAALTCEPGDLARVSESVRQVADALARDGLTEEEFERARQPLLQAAPAQLRNNAYWLASCVDTAQSRPELLAMPRTRTSDLEQMTVADVMARAAEVLPARRASVFSAIPAAMKKK